MIIKTSELTFLGVSERKFKNKDNEEITYYKAKLAEGTDVFEMSASKDVYDLLKDLGTATGEAEVQIQNKVKDGKSQVGLRLVSFTA